MFLQFDASAVWLERIKVTFISNYGTDAALHPIILQSESVN